ncbi:hypothetical protein GWA97_00635 [Flavobacterium sp. LaA7.5]|nr:hypothetical protein [Flavobacterium salilacus subsp. altitudinum]
MTIAIHDSKLGFHERWVNYCKNNNIPYKLVNCYSNNIIQELDGCKALLWHHNQSDPRDILIAKELLFALEHTGFEVFPNFKTGWHFDDKVGQKYLFERLKLPFVPTYVFVEKKTALAWANNTTFPKVFKLRGGAGSANVKLARTKDQAISFINKAFGKGFKQYEALSNLKERIRMYKEGKMPLSKVLIGVLRIGYEPKFSKVIGREMHYAYFQDFIPNNDFDIRIIVINNKAIGLKRMVRKNDFRASGSGNVKFNKEEFDIRCVKISFDTAKMLQTQSAALDFVFDKNNEPLIVEISYGFFAPVYDDCPGYWDDNLNWHEAQVKPQDWMVESILEKL